MKHFSLRLALLIAAVIALSVISFWLYSRGLWPQASIVLIADVVAVIMLVNLVSRLSSLISTFLKSMLAGDSTMRFDYGRNDPLVGDLARDMNSISSIYQENKGQLETSKLYYDRILKIMTHEMRNYVTPVISLTSDVSDHPDRYSSPSALLEVISLIHSQSSGIRRFLDSYYRLTHLPPLSVSQISAADFAKRIIQLLPGELTSRNLDLSVCQFEVPQDMHLSIDISLMTQVFINLIRNALDSVSSVDNPAVTVSISASETHPFITVSDNGPGISPSIAENLFQPFFTTKPDGCGVGLTICRQIVRQHGGDLYLLASNSSVTTFAISLPN